MLNNGVLASREKVNSAEQWCCSIGRGKAKQLLDGVVSSMKDDEEVKRLSIRGGGKKV